MKKFIFTLALLSLVTLSVSAVDAREFRERRDIKTKLNAEKFVDKNDGSTKLAVPLKLDDQLIRASIQSVFDNWGTLEIAKYLGDKFPNRNQLLAAFDRHVPYDARLEVRGIRAIRTLNQRAKDGNVISLIAADVETEVFYQDPSLGVQRLNGTSEYVFELVTREG